MHLAPAYFFTTNHIDICSVSAMYVIVMHEMKSRGNSIEHFQ